MRPYLYTAALAGSLFISAGAFAQSNSAMMGGTTTATSPSAQSSMNGSAKNDVSGSTNTTKGNAIKPPMKNSSTTSTAGKSTGSGMTGSSTGSMGSGMSPGGGGSGK